MKSLHLFLRSGHTRPELHQGLIIGGTWRDIGEFGRVKKESNRFLHTLASMMLKEKRFQKLERVWL